MSTIDELVREHRKVVEVARRRGDEALHLWYADLGVEVLEDDRVKYYCPHCGKISVRTVHEFVYCDTNECLMCETCRGDVEERAGALD